MILHFLILMMLDLRQSSLGFFTLSEKKEFLFLRPDNVDREVRCRPYSWLWDFCDFMVLNRFLLNNPCIYWVFQFCIIYWVDIRQSLLFSLICAFILFWVMSMAWLTSQILSAVRFLSLDCLSRFSDVFGWRILASSRRRVEALSVRLHKFGSWDSCISFSIFWQPTSSLSSIQSRPRAHVWHRLRTCKKARYVLISVYFLHYIGHFPSDQTNPRPNAILELWIETLELRSLTNPL